MTNTKLILNMLAEASAKDISQATEPETMEDNIRVAKQGGTVARVAREELELRTSKKVVSPINANKAFGTDEMDKQQDNK
jgi:L-asparaginase/Glu-tRNA(Gln) amidotransferase subunit D